MSWEMRQATFARRIFWGVEIIITFGALILGILYCFIGARLSAWLFLMNGFLISFGVALSPVFQLRTGLATVLGIAGGIGLAIVFGSAARISHFIMGAVLGAVLGAMIDPVAMLVLAAVAGIASLLFKKPMMILATSVTGAFLIVVAIQSWVLGRSVGGMLLARAVSHAGGGEPILSQQAVGAFVFVALAGLLVQSLSGRLRNLADAARAGSQLPEEKPTIRSMVRRPSALPLKPSAHADRANATGLDTSGQSDGDDAAGVPKADETEHEGASNEEPGALEPEEPLGEHQATWTEDVDLPNDSLPREELIETVLAWERSTPIALAALARFLDSTGTVQARALVVRHGVAADHRLVTGAFQQDLGLGDLLVSPALLDGTQGRILLEFTASSPVPETATEESGEGVRDRQITVTRDTFRLSDRRPTREQIVEALLRWERPQAGYDAVVVSVLNIQDEPIARALAVAKDLGIPPSELTEEVQRDWGIDSPVAAFFQVEGVTGTLLVEI